MRAKLCATVIGATTEELRANRDRVAGADLVELRLDYVRHPDVAGALADRRCPVVVTCRPTWEGGQFDGSEEERRRLLTEALELGAEYVDLEWQAGFDDLIRSRQGSHIVLSMHDFEGLPTDLAERYRTMRATGAEIVKIAAFAGTLSASLALREIERTESAARRVVVAMGAAGVPSRVLPDRFGSCWTYAGEGVASGQVDLERMLREFRVREISDTTQVYGVLGAPLGHSLSPAMHNAGFAATGTDAVYLPFEASDVDDFVTFAKAFRVSGASVTAPYKQEIAGHLTETDDLIQHVGAVNTVRMRGETWAGCNTDVPSFLEPLAGRMSLAGCRAAVLGAGGAARGVAVALLSQGAEVTVCARNAEKAAMVAQLVNGSVGTLPPAAGSWDLLVNTTPLGMHPAVDATPMPERPFDGRLVYDLVYNPRVTRLLADAAAAGCETIGGLGMLVAQAVRQFEWWTGARPPVDVFEDAAERRLAQLMVPRES